MVDKSWNYMIEQKLEPITATYPQKAVSCKHKMQVQDGHPAKLDNRGSTASNRQNSLKKKSKIHYKISTEIYVTTVANHTDKPKNL